MDVTWMLLWVSCAWLLLACEGSRVVQPKKNSIKNIKTVDGDVFDCVHIYKQPAFDHPSLKDHKVQMKPSSIPKVLTDDVPLENLISQFKLEGEGCPDGYIPVQRTERNDLVGEKLDLAVGVSKPTTSDQNDNGKSWWATIVPRGDAWIGGGAALSVWNPPVGAHQLSATLMWMTNAKTNAILTAGWHAAPARFNDNRTRLAIAWNNQNGDVASCYNLQCPGFVQTNTKVTLGSLISPISEYKGAQYVIRVYIFKDELTGHWWFSFGSPSNVVGYWPKEIFTNGLDTVDELYYGGFVNCRQDDRCPPMGNGERAAPSDDDFAAFVNEVKFVASKIDLPITVIDNFANNVNCYNYGDYSNEAGFHFGGPGCS